MSLYVRFADMQTINHKTISQIKKGENPELPQPDFPGEHRIYEHKSKDLKEKNQTYEMEINRSIYL